MNDRENYSTIPIDVFFTHDQQFLAVDLDRLTAVLGQITLSPAFSSSWRRSPLSSTFAVADSDDFTHVRLFSSIARQHDTRSGFFFSFKTLDHNTVMQRANSHGNFSCIDIRAQYVLNFIRG